VTRAPLDGAPVTRGHRGRARLVVVGDALLDRDLEGRAGRLAPDAPVPVVDDPAERRRPGGAALAATLAARLDGRAVVLITALAADEAGAALRELLELAGVEVVDLGLSGSTPEKVRVRADGHSLVRLDRATRPGRVGPLGPAGRRALAGAGAVLVADYGHGLAAEPGVRAVLARLPSRRPMIWDPHPRGPAPVPGARLATPNRAEAAGFAPEVEGDGLTAMTTRARLLAERWGAAGVAVTLGARGALLVEGAGAPLVIPATPARGGDPCGAGDRFATTAAGLLADGALPSEAVAGAVTAATAFVTAGGAGMIDLEAGATPRPEASAIAHLEARATAHLGPGAPPTLGAPHPHPPVPGAPGWEGNPQPEQARTVVHSPPTHTLPPRSPDGGDPLDRALALIAGVRARGGTVVATGGCFDLLHAGHVATLRAARALGDCLVVCLNSDGSVRRLKGLERPLVPQADRVAVLEALGCVDAVVPFDERTPEAVLQRLRPDVFAKGGDYALAHLPEAALLATWGGQAVILPYLEGRSTTQLMKEVVRRDSH
jgi:D-beta-D-heptose 7-phosphate kinase / D-beta-D-heptose 1-phosphate adenosyltransferase